MTAQDPVEALHAAGRVAHPALQIDPVAFAAAVEARGGPSALGPHAADLYLAIGCELGLAPALAHLEQAVLPLIDRLLRQRERDAAVREEILQQVRLRALVADRAAPRIGTYAARSTLVGWLRVMATRLHANHLRDEQRRAARVPEVQSLAATPERLLLVGLAPLAAAALGRAAKRLPPRDRALLRLVYGSRAPLEEVGAMYGVHKATISRWIAAARAALLTLALEDLRAETGVATDTLAAACAELTSQLDLSLRAFYSTASAGDEP